MTPNMQVCMYVCVRECVYKDANAKNEQVKKQNAAKQEMYSAEASTA